MLWLWAALQDCGRGYFDESESYKCANDISDRKGHMADRMRPLPLPSDCYLKIPLTHLYYDCGIGSDLSGFCSFDLPSMNWRVINAQTIFRIEKGIWPIEWDHFRYLPTVISKSRWPTDDTMTVSVVIVVAAAAWKSHFYCMAAMETRSTGTQRTFRDQWQKVPGYSKVDDPLQCLVVLSL